MVFEAWRTNGGPTQHPAMPTAVTSDVLEIGFVFAFCILAFSFVLIIPGYKGISRLYFLLRVVISLFIGASIFLGVLGQDWESAEIQTKTAYKAFTNTEIHAKVGMRIGLGSVNVTLKGTPVYQTVGHSDSVNFTERIDYNERFHWAWRQGRIGFGPYSGRINQEFRDAQYRGVPLPIQWVAEYFTLDGELIRWGRSYRTAGWFANEVLWTAVPVWLIANILSGVVLFYAGCMFMLTSVFMFVSLIIWSTIKWGYQPLSIPFEDDVLHTHYGASFWLVMSGGIVSFLYGAIIVGADWFVPQLIADFFGTDVLQDNEQFYHKKEEEAVQPLDIENKGSQHQTVGGVQRRLATNISSTADRMARGWASRRRKSRATLKKDLHLDNEDSERNGGVYSNPAFEEEASHVPRRSVGFSDVVLRVVKPPAENSNEPDYDLAEDIPTPSGGIMYENKAYEDAAELNGNEVGNNNTSVDNTENFINSTAM
uniref:Dual oxidase maturation factor 1-like n=1 Tax=Ciona intestinalis TaxID=7719 RepID=A0A1W5BEV8_CIOIN|nr:dual oxidase maturation factor 1-like isoform X2 [Ciona intestinalis]XP_018670860.1 dual oxidase maturation factor 1-like isoform X1 [Ciona intestinalis]|eukprot:XP_002123520.2 dual oxidase maturation factor 1-like isoform X2 [Ciona intestinalis]